MKPMYFLVNPRGRRKRNAPKRATRRRQKVRARTLGRALAKTKRRPPHGFPTWAAWMASIRPNSPRSTTMAKKKRTRRRHNPPRAHRRRRRNPPRRHTARRTTRRNPFARHHRRRRTRRNPPVLNALKPKAILKNVAGAAVDALGIVGGKVATRYIRGKIPATVLDTTNPHKAMAVDTALSIALGIAGGLLHPKVGKLLLTGGLVGVAENAVKSLNIDAVNQALGDGGFIPGMGGYIPGMGSYVPALPAPAAGMGAYVGGMAGADPEELLNY